MVVRNPWRNAGNWSGTIRAALRTWHHGVVFRSMSSFEALAGGSPHCLRATVAALEGVNPGNFLAIPMADGHVLEAGESLWHDLSSGLAGHHA